MTTDDFAIHGLDYVIQGALAEWAAGASTARCDAGAKLDAERDAIRATRPPVSPWGLRKDTSDEPL